MTGRRRWALAGAAIVLGILILARPVAVRGDGVDATLWLWAWQQGSVEFTNSVTGAPVRIDFGLATGFDHFEMITDEKTEHYYTGGGYAIGERLAGQRNRRLEYCSMVGMAVQLGRHRFQVADGCLKLESLWPPL